MLQRLPSLKAYGTTATLPRSQERECASGRGVASARCPSGAASGRCRNAPSDFATLSVVDRGLARARGRLRRRRRRISEINDLRIAQLNWLVGPNFRRLRSTDCFQHRLPLQASPSPHIFSLNQLVIFHLKSFTFNMLRQLESIVPERPSGTV